MMTLGGEVSWRSVMKVERWQGGIEKDQEERNLKHDT
jgi:hypothetical protein